MYFPKIQNLFHNAEKTARDDDARRLTLHILQPLILKILSHF